MNAAFPSWSSGPECAEQVAQCFLESSFHLAGAVAWMKENAWQCEQAKSHPDLVDVLTGDEVDAVIRAMREFAMLLDRAALIKLERGGG